MKNLTINRSLIAIIVIGFAISSTSCKKENNKPTSGFSDNIKNNIPDSILQIARDMGLQINEGKTPPTIPSIFLLDSILLEKSNFADVYSIGTRFANYKYRTSNQNNTNLTITIETKFLNINTGVLLGQDPPTIAYLSGNGNLFSVFIISKSYSTFTPTDSTSALTIISGEVTSNGIKNPKFLNIMLNDFGDPYDRYIQIGQGRLFREADNFATNQTVFRLANTINNTSIRKSICIQCN